MNDGLRWVVTQFHLDTRFVDAMPFSYMKPLSGSGSKAMMIYFFSSRRRHTIYWRDWSSDVCSSDLAFHHGAGRHAFVRPRRLFRARRLWRGAAGEMAGRADGLRARSGAADRARRRAAVRLVRRAAVWSLSRHAHIGLRADRLGGGVPVGKSDRRLQRRDRRVAAAAIRPGLGLL